MKNFFSLVLLCAIGMAVSAQMPGNFQQGGQQGPKITGRFYGKVVDIANKGIEAVSVILVGNQLDSVTKKPKEVIVGGMLTTPSGDFSIENVPVFGKYTLRISGIGYKQLDQPVAFEMPKRDGSATPGSMMGALDKDLGNIAIEVDAAVLSSVTVTSSKPLLQLGIDRKIFNVEKDLVSQGGTAVDVMKNVPSVNVDIDGNVTLRNAAPQIFVDGRPTTLTLDQIPADAIESVEIITNPSAKFDASGGTSGILNIVLKKNKRVGYSGNVRMNIDSRGMVGGGGDVNIRQNKINFFASGMYHPRKSISEGLTTRQNRIFNTSSSTQTDNNEMNGAFGFGRFGIDYFIDNRNTLTISQVFVRGKMKPSNMSSILVDLNSDGSVDSLLERISNSQFQFRNMGTQIGFKHNFPKAGREWTADITYNKSRNENNNLISADYYVMPGRTFDDSYGQEQMGSGRNENLIIQTDYINPLNDKSKFELGARIAIRDVNSGNNFFNVSSNGTKTPVPEQNILYKSRDQVYAAYATYSNRVKDFGYQLGLRAESSDYEGDLVGKNQSFKINFPISLFPSVFLSQKLSESDDLQLNYSRRINRPGFWQLFPFTDVSDIFNIEKGNPNLKPEFTNSLELSYSHMFENRDNFITSVYFKNTNDLITRFQEAEFVPAYDSTMLVSSYINANSSYITGLELTGKNKITKWWEVTSNVNLFTAAIDLEDQPDPDQFVSYFVKLNNTIRLPKNLSLQISADYRSKIISSPGGGGRGFGGGMFGGSSNASQGFIRANFGVDAGVRFEFLKERRASISVNINDIFKTRKYDSHSESPFFVQDAERRRDWQVVRINLNWRFGKFDANLFKSKNTRAENNVNMEGANF